MPTDSASRPRGPWDSDTRPEIAPWIGYAWARAGEQLARLLPHTAATRAAALIALGYRFLSRRRMTMIRKHLTMVCPGASETEIDSMVDRAVSLYALYWLETFRTPDMDRREIAALVTTEGEENLAEVMAEGKGAIITMPHLGNWDVAGAYCAEYYTTPLVVAEVLRPQAAFDYWVRTREKLGMEVVGLDGTSASARSVIKALRDGRPVALVADRDLTSDGIEVEFFGEKTTIPAGPATIAARTGAAIVPVGVYIEDGGRYRAVVRQALRVDSELPKPERLSLISQQVVNEFEALIRREPEQWHLFTPNWPSDWRALGEVPPGRGAGAPAPKQSGDV